MTSFLKRFLLILLLWSAAALPARSMAQVPVVFWASTPVQPGETILLYGDALERVEDIRLLRLADESAGLPVPSALQHSPAEGLSCQPLQPSQVSVKCVLPQKLQPGVFVAWVHTADGWSQPLLLNQPVPWWVQGDSGTAATPGGWIRVSGTNLSWPMQQPSMPRLALVSTTSNQLSWLEISERNAYSMKVSLPPDLSEGRYQVWVHNGLGGPNAWTGYLFIQVQQRLQWPTTVLNVKDFGAVGDGDQDDTQAIGQALEQASRQGGHCLFASRSL